MITTWLFGLVAIAAAEAAFEMKDFNDLAKARKSDHIVLNSFTVPAGKTLALEGLKPGTVIEFAGTLKFGYAEWKGPLIKIKGKNIKVSGRPNHLIDCEGKRWWDHHGGNKGKLKPKFMSVKLEDSTVTGLNVLNLPVHGFSIDGSRNLKVSRININVKDGDTMGGHNTDGFDVGESSGVTISNCYVHNQDDCLAINSGKDIVFEDNVCIGGHGISIGSVGGRSDNDVQRVTVRRCKVIGSTNGIRIKTLKNGHGSVTDIKYEDVVIENASKYGIIIQGNYHNSGCHGDPTPGVPIKGLTVNNVRGTVLPGGTNVYVWVANASNWKWNAKLTGGKKIRPNKGVPNGVNV